MQDLLDLTDLNPKVNGECVITYIIAACILLIKLNLVILRIEFITGITKKSIEVPTEIEYVYYCNCY